jgi:hypothetical protein
MNGMEMFLLVGFPSAMAIAFTILLCRHQDVRHKPISIWTVCLGASGAAASYFLCTSPDMLTRHFWVLVWHDTMFPPSSFFLFCVGFPLLICLFSSAAVAVFYRTRREKPNPEAQL